MLAYRSYKPSLRDQLKNQSKVAGNHPIKPVKENLSEPEILIDRLEDREKKPEKNARIDNQHAKRTVS